MTSETRTSSRMRGYGVDEDDDGGGGGLDVELVDASDAGGGDGGTSLATNDPLAFVGALGSPEENSIIASRFKT